MSPDDGPEQIVLGRVSTQARLFGRLVDAQAVERRLDDVAREALPLALAATLGNALGGQDGIIRIDAIDIDFAIDRQALDRSELATRWAARLGAVIAERMTHPHGGGIARFASYGHFVAAYLEHRFAVALHPHFAFADFASLEHVTPADAAIELLAARPAYLAELAIQAQRLGRPAWLADRLDDHRAATLIERIFADAALPEAPEPGAFRAMMATAPAGWRLHGPARAALVLTLARLAAGDPASIGPVPATLMLARLVTALDLLSREAPEALAALASDNLSRLASPVELPSAHRQASALLRALLANPRWRALAGTIARTMTPDPRRPNGEDADRDATRPARPLATPPSLSSPFAGLVLTLPVLRTLALGEQLHPAQFRALLVAMIAPADAMREEADRLAAFLMPTHDADPPPPWPALPDGGDGEPSAESWAAFVLRGFAARLPGLQESTAPYLRRQFLHGSGDLAMEDKSLVARLVRPPLAMVLSMAGMTGDQGALPWLGARRLRIDLT